MKADDIKPGAFKLKNQISLQIGDAMDAVRIEDGMRVVRIPDNTTLTVRSSSLKEVGYIDLLVVGENSSLVFDDYHPLPLVGEAE